MPIFEWFVVRCAFKNIHEKDKCLQKIRLSPQNIITTLGSVVNIIGEAFYDHLMSGAWFFTLLNKKISM